MTDRELLYIKTIAEEKNISHAAQKLHIAQPSLTQCIQRIEKNLDCPLFYRQKSGLVLTDAGNLYYKAACEILNIWEKFSIDISNIHQLNAGSLTIGASWYSTLLLLTNMLPQYRQLYPQVNVRLTEKNSTDLERSLFNGELDLIFTHLYPKEMIVKKAFESKRFISLPLMRERFCVIVSKAYSLDSDSKEISSQMMSILDIQKLANIPYVRFTENQRIRHISDFILKQVGLHPPIALSTYGFPSAYELVSKGMGFTFLPELYVKNFLSKTDDIQIYQIDSSYSAYWTAAVCYYQSDYMPVTVQRFLDLIKELKLFYE